MALLQLDEVHTYYGQSYILQGVSLQIEPGEVIGLLGRNGVGKTTTIRTIIGFNPPRRGSIRFQGQSLEKQPPHKIGQAGIGLVPQGRSIFPNLSVRENLLVAARPNSKSKVADWTLERVYRLFPVLEERASNWGNQLSGGEQQMLAIGRALMTNPALILMDEPSEGLAPLMVRTIGQHLRQLKEAGFAILLVEQNLKMAFELCDRLYVMNKGQIVFTGSRAELQENEEIKHQHLGV